MKVNTTPIEDSIDVEDETIQWYDIPLFEDYQISNNNFMVRYLDGSKYGGLVESKKDIRDKYLGDIHVYLPLKDGRRINAKNADLWDLVVRAQSKPKSTTDTYYNNDYDPVLFPECNSITGFPDKFKVLGMTTYKRRKVAEEINGII
jgi:hypothetical protein